MITGITRTVLIMLLFFTVFASSMPLHGHEQRSHRRIRRQPTTCKPKNARFTSSRSVATLGSALGPDFSTAPAKTISAVQSEVSASEPSATTQAPSNPSASEAATESPEPDEGESSPKSDLLSSLFPVESSGKSWSTAEGAENEYDLSDSTFQLTNLITSLSHDYEEKAGKSAMKAHFPQGSYTFKHDPQGGLSFYAPGPDEVDLSTAKEATFGYSVYFQEGFQFNMGGKLPGLFGGDSYDGGVGCSGGSRNDNCFSARLMWRTDAAGEMYTYLPPSFDANQNVCNISPYSECNPTYGASVARGSFYFKSGEWNTVAERVKLNDINSDGPVANGELELFVGGKSVVSVGGLVLRSNESVKMRGLQVQTFFGGSKPEWASPQDQDLWFADFSVQITETL